ncbi:AAA domain-containing protein [Paraphysoderma sedebokerense]|nr:AAA domain-containing protein [Paraphysoderma sedebokerense]KAI9140572.1 AAA domain-containing protein [Paraphysoderma sedebokerense]KAI9140579.1 AAA domain-containing protein [Paraphysoderma sedebokerense]
MSSTVSADAERFFVVLYTSQKHKKAKTWSDGTLKFLKQNSKGILLDERNNRVDSGFVSEESLRCGNEIEFDRHLIQIESNGKYEERSNDCAVAATEIPKPIVRRFMLPKKSAFKPPISGEKCAVMPAVSRTNTNELKSDRRLAKTKFTVLYTHQKQKKAKTWLDGFAVYIQNESKMVLYNQKKSRLESILVPGPPSIGDDLEFERFLVTIEGPTGQEQIKPHSPSSNTGDLLVKKPPLRKFQRPRTTLLKQLPSTAESSHNATPTLPNSESPETKDSSIPRVNDDVDGVLDGDVDVDDYFDQFEANPDDTRQVKSFPEGQSSSHNQIPKKRKLRFDAWQDDDNDYVRPNEDVRHEEDVLNISKTQNDAMVNTNSTADKSNIAISFSNGLPAKWKSDEPVKYEPQIKRIHTDIIVDNLTCPQTSPILQSKTHLESNNIDSAPTVLRASEVLKSRPKRPIVNNLYFPSLEFIKDIQKSGERLERKVEIPTSFTFFTEILLKSSGLSYQSYLLAAIHEHLQIQITGVALKYFGLIRNYVVEDSDCGVKLPSNIESRARSNYIPLYLGCGLSTYEPDPKLLRFQPSVRQRKGNILLAIQNREPSSHYGKDDIWVVSKSPLFVQASSWMGRSVFHGVSSGNSVELKPLTDDDARTAKRLCSSRDYTPGSGIIAIRLFNASDLTILDHSSVISGPQVNRSNPKAFKPPSSTSSTLETGLESFRNEAVDLCEETITEFTLNEDQAAVLRKFALSLVDGATNGDGPLVSTIGVFGSGKSYLLTVLIVYYDRLIKSLNIAWNKIQRILVASNTNVAVDRILCGLVDLGFDEFVRVGSLKKISKRILPYTAQMKQSEDLKELKSMLNDESLSDAEKSSIQTTIKRFKANENKDTVSKALIVGCHPTISAIPNALFYQHRLLNGKSECELNPLVDGLPTLSFVDVDGVEQKVKGGSWVNERELAVVGTTIEKLIDKGIKAEEIGVIALYKAQSDRIRTHLRGSATESSYKGIQVSTVDAFQGAEKSVIIVSCTRTHSIGFSDDTKRVNVLLTRAKRHLIITGYGRLLRTNSLWGRVVNEFCAKIQRGVMDCNNFLRYLDTLAAINENTDPVSGLTVCAGSEIEVTTVTRNSKTDDKIKAIGALSSDITEMVEFESEIDDCEISIEVTGFEDTEIHTMSTDKLHLESSVDNGTKTDKCPDTGLLEVHESENIMSSDNESVLSTLIEELPPDFALSNLEVKATNLVVENCFRTCNVDEDEDDLEGLDDLE